jgi:hypothetical protein
MLSSTRRLGNQKISSRRFTTGASRGRISDADKRIAAAYTAAEICRSYYTKEKTRSEKGGLKEFERAAREGLESTARCDIRELNSEPIPILETGAL